LTLSTTLFCSKIYVNINKHNLSDMIKQDLRVKVVDIAGMEACFEEGALAFHRLYSWRIYGYGSARGLDSSADYGVTMRVIQ
jgi:hypothetical protein